MINNMSRYIMIALLWLQCLAVGAQTKKSIGTDPMETDSIISIKPDSISYSGRGTVSADDFNVPVYLNSPEAAALAKMVNYPVNYHTGIPNISIPLHVVQTGDMEIPIELNYHAGGFKINEQATRTGLGWSLSCDLQITRTVNGLDDLEPGGYINNNRITLNNYPFQGSYNDPYEGKKNAYYMAVTQEQDGMPDKFYYKLLNKSGSFYFLKDGASWSIVPVPYDNIKIEYSKTNYNFTITDVDGTVYQFGHSGAASYDDPQIKSVELSGSSKGTAKITSWKCVKITAPNRTDEIEFTYERVPVKQYQTYRDRIEYWSTFYQTQSVNYADQSHLTYLTYYEHVLNAAPFHKLSSPKYINYTSSVTFHLPYVDANEVVHDKEYIVISPDHIPYISSYIAGVCLKKINYRGGKVEFRGGNLLNEIVVTERDSINIKLYQSLAENTNYLDSLRIGADRYAFLYHTRNNGSKYAFGGYYKGQDAWGFSNIQTQAVSSYTPLLMPRIRGKIKSRYLPTQHHGFPLFFGGQTTMAEEPSEWEMQRGILKRIVYPMGGFVVFDYEANRYTEERYEHQGMWSNFKIQRMSGGLRIKNITYFEDDLEKGAKQLYYVYGNLEEGTGNVVNAPKLMTNNNVAGFRPFSFTQIHHYVMTSPDNVSANVFTRDSLITYLPYSSLDCAYPNGAPVYYTKVTEYQMDKGVKTGKTVYEYYPEYQYFPYDNPYNNLYFITWDRVWNENTGLPYQRADWYLGALKSVSEYRYKAGKFELMHSKQYDYQKYQREQHPLVAYAFPKEIYKTVELSPLGNFSGHPCHFYEFQTDIYSVPVGKLLLTHETENWYEENNTSTQITKQYFYDDLYQGGWLQPTKEVTTDGLGTHTKQFTYTYHSNNGVLAAMKKRNIISPVVETVQKSNQQEVQRIRTNYTTAVFNNDTIFVKSDIQRSFNGGALKDEIVFLEYDKYGNVIHAKGQDKLYKSYI